MIAIIIVAAAPPRLYHHQPTTTITATTTTTTTTTTVLSYFSKSDLILVAKGVEVPALRERTAESVTQRLLAKLRGSVASSSFNAC